MSDLPDPPVPSDATLSDFAYTPIFRARLFGSSFHAKASDSEWRAGVTLWLKSQDQVPAGSLPDDDIELCRLAELGRDLKTWKKIRKGSLHGWYKCGDGRLYNNTVAEVALSQWQSKVEQRARTLKARIAALEKRLSQATDPSVTEEITHQLQTLRQSTQPAQSQALSQPPVTETKGREGRVKGREYIESHPVDLGIEDLEGLAQGETGGDGPFTGQETSDPTPISVRALAAMRGRR